MKLKNWRQLIVSNRQNSVCALVFHFLSTIKEQTQSLDVALVKCKSKFVQWKFVVTKSKKKILWLFNTSKHILKELSKKLLFCIFLHPYPQISYIHTISFTQFNIISQKFQFRSVPFHSTRFCTLPQFHEWSAVFLAPGAWIHYSHKNRRAFDAGSRP